MCTVLSLLALAAVAYLWRRSKGQSTTNLEQRVRDLELAERRRRQREAETRRKP